METSYRRSDFFQIQEACSSPTRLSFGLRKPALINIMDNGLKLAVGQPDIGLKK